MKLARISRASYYRFDENAEVSADSDMDLRDAIQRIALEWPSYGRRRVTHELRCRGWTANWKRVYRLMREDNLLCVRKRKFVITTDSNHGRRVYPNLAGEMVLTDVDQLWVADITYIRLQTEFVYLAVILDAHSRRVIGWALDQTLEDELTLGALRMALSQRMVGPDLVHHSDRGSHHVRKLRAAGSASPLQTQSARTPVPLRVFHRFGNGAATVADRRGRSAPPLSSRVRLVH